MKCDKCDTMFYYSHACDIGLARKARECIAIHTNNGKREMKGYVKIECFNKEDVDNFKSFFTEEELKHIKFTRLY